jgi:hypothetical protein
MTMPNIESYSFGKIVVGGKTITSDLIIYPDGQIQKNWRRREGHNLIAEDLFDLLSSAPSIMVIGSGANGFMSVSKEVSEECRTRGIEVRAMPTADAVEEYNRIQSTGSNVGACFHLTC